MHSILPTIMYMLLITQLVGLQYSFSIKLHP